MKWIGKNKEIATIDNHGEIVGGQESTPAKLLEIAISKDLDIDKLERLMEMQRQYEQRQSEMAFNNAMKAAQNEMPAVAKKAHNNQTNSSYAKLEHIINQCAPIWTNHGFSLSFNTEPSVIEGHIRIICIVSHTGGHSRTVAYDLPFDGTGIKGNVNKTAIHASASTLSYGRRYLTCLIFNIGTFDDSDGNMPKPNIKRITEDQAADIKAMIDEVKADKAAFLKWLKVESIEKIPAQALDHAIRALENKRNANN